MSDDYVFDIPSGEGSCVEHLSPHGHACKLSGLSIMAMPPGKVDVTLESQFIGLNVLPYGPETIHRYRFNGSDVRRQARGWPVRSALYGGGELELVCENPNWEVLIELDVERTPELIAEALDGVRPQLPEIAFRNDTPTQALARLSIEHLRHGEPDRLYTEGLAIAMMARAFKLANGRVSETSSRGTDARVARAIDYAEAYLDADLSIAELARVAAMSPSWFRDCFHAETGQSVHAYVRERRLERARLLLAERDLSIARIANACGFADQSHLTRAFKQRFGVTPGKAREN